jgi:hypothetical protein
MHSVPGKMSGKVVAKSADVTVVVIALNGQKACQGRALNLNRNGEPCHCLAG